MIQMWMFQNLIIWLWTFFAADEEGKATGSSNQLQAMRNKDEAQQMMKSLYASFITDPVVRKRIREILQLLLATPEGATLWHCSAGKDRAGITQPLF